MRKLFYVGISVLAVATLSAAGSQAAAAKTSTHATAVVRVSTRTLPKLGTVLVTSTSRTLYMFVPDKQSKVTCIRACAAVWPPLKLPAGAKQVAGGAAKASLLGSDRDPAGGRVVTYHGWPLYTYVGDRAAGQAKDQALKLNGGYWYVLSSAGKVIRTKPGDASAYP